MGSARSIIGLVWIVGFGVGCSGRATQTDAGTSDARAHDTWRFDARPPDGLVPDAPGPDATPLDTGVVDSSPSCVAAIGALQAELYAKTGQTCSVVVRLDYQTRALLGYQVFCGAYAAPDEQTARATAQQDTGYGSSGMMLNASTAEDAYVFYVAPGDIGGASAVAKRSGLSVFGGSIIWAGGGDITYPKSWRPASELASGCAPLGIPPPAVGYSLGAGHPGTVEIAAANDVVRQTAVPAAFWGGGYLFDVVVLAYARDVGAFEPTTAEWIVVVNGGWLE